MSTISDIRSMNPYEFEKLVARVWSSEGYNTNVRQGSNDKGVDVEANSGNHKILIQAKRYAADNKVGGPAVRTYATLYQQDPDANQVIIVTTSFFTAQAKEISAEQNVTLINGNKFVSMMDENNVCLNKPDQKTDTNSTSRSTTKPSTSKSTTKPSTSKSTTKPSTSKSTTKSSTSKSNKTHYQYFDKCLVCEGDIVWETRDSGDFTGKCSQCGSEWKKENAYKSSMRKWKGISGKVEGKSKTKTKWKQSFGNTDSGNGKSSSTRDSTQEGADDVGLFEHLASFTMIFLFLSLLHTLLSSSFHSYQLLLIILLAIFLFAGAVVKVIKENR